MNSGCNNLLICRKVIVKRKKLLKETETSITVTPLLKHTGDVCNKCSLPSVMSVQECLFIAFSLPVPPSAGLSSSLK